MRPKGVKNGVVSCDTSSLKQLFQLYLNMVRMFIGLLCKKLVFLVDWRYIKEIGGRKVSKRALSVFNLLF
jgi:hypothetical protein